MTRLSIHKIALQWLAIIGLCLGAGAPVGAMAPPGLADTAGAVALDVPPGGNWILICTPTGSQWLNLDNPEERQPVENSGKAVNCAGCTLIAGKVIGAEDLGEMLVSRRRLSWPLAAADNWIPRNRIAHSIQPRAPPA